MLKKETIAKLEAVLGLEVGKLQPMIADEAEVTLDVPTLFTEEDKTTFGANRFKEGKKAGFEILAKEVKEKYEVTVDGKDIYKIIDAVSLGKVEEAKLPIDDQVKTLKKDKEDLQLSVTTSEGKLAAAEADFASRLFNVEIKQSVRSFLPENTTVSKDDLTELFLMKHQIQKDDEGKNIIIKDGVALQDTLKNNLALEAVVKPFAETYIKQDGMGGGDKGDGGSPDKFQSMSQFAKWAKANDMSATSDKALSVLSKKKADNFVYDEVAEEDM